MSRRHTFRRCQQCGQQYVEALAVHHQCIPADQRHVPTARDMAIRCGVLTPASEKDRPS
jgi:hypothetical protein